MNVYVHGSGAVTPFGSWEASVVALSAGATAVRPISRFDAEGFPSTVAAAIEIDAKDRRLEIAQKALDSALLLDTDRIVGKRVGLFIGAESGRATFATILQFAGAAGIAEGASTFDHKRFAERAAEFADGFDMTVISPAAVASSFAQVVKTLGGNVGPVRTISLACASSSAAVAEAYHAIKLGVCDVAVCGGVGADVDPVMSAGFGLLGALSAKGVSRPFDSKRDGFVIGEGAAMFILSSDRDGAKAEIAGVGRTLDAFHLTKPEPRGDGAIRAMRIALQTAEIENVDYVQAHGTSTLLNDRVEAEALRSVFGEKLDDCLVSSIKGAVGHWIAGAGAIGLMTALEAIETGNVFPTACLEEIADGCELPHVKHRSQNREVNAALVNSFAFGGANCSIVVKKCE